MGEESKYFDLVILMGFGDLEIMGAAIKNLSLQVADYFNLLSEVDINLPNCVAALGRISDYKAEENDLENLETIENLLGEIGFDKAVPVIKEIVKARKNGQIDIAADGAKEAFKDLSRLQVQISAAKKARKAETDDAAEGKASSKNFETLFLKDALMQLEQEEAARKLRILAVDDSPAMLNTVSSVLGEEYKVFVIPKPKMVEKFLSQITPDLILLDYEMPEMNGFELIPIIRNFGEHKDTPIIFLTSLGTMEHVSAAAKLGACDFIVKPFQGDNLREKVAKHIVRKKLTY